MYGFYIYKVSDSAGISDLQFNDVQSLKLDGFVFHHKKFSKFEKDKIFKETTKYIIGLDGVILNLINLKKTYAISDSLKLIQNLFEKEGIGFITKLKGEFSGFIYTKENKTLIFFNNKTATKQVFYSKFNDNFVIAPTIESIIEAREEVAVKNSLNVNAAYNLLTFGGMIENTTLVKDVYKLGAGEYLKFNDKKFEVKKYFDYNDIEVSISDKKQAINRLDEAFIEALKLEYEKDIEYGYKHIATLSGGLDSRMNVMLAEKMGYKPLTFCFSQSKYDDEIIARQISKNLNFDFKFIPLDGGDYLKNLEEMVAINNGLQYYNGSAHFHFALNQLDLSSYGLMHTGQIGDAILGGLVSNKKHQNYLSKVESSRFINKVRIEKSLFKSYRDEEVFKLYQRIFNLTNFGSYTLEHNQTYLVSPFLDDEVINVSMSIQPNLKFNQDIYIDWIRTKHLEVTKYKWERTGFRPHKKWLTELSRYTKKIKKEYLIFTQQQNKLSMNPAVYWFKSNPSIREFYNTFYQSNIKLVSENTELFTDLTEMYSTGNLTEKALTLTLLEVIRKFKLKV